MANTNPRNESNDWGRKHHVDGWRHLDGGLPEHGPATHKMPKRRRGLQTWYAPRRFEPGSLLDAWPFLVCALVTAGCILWARSQGWLP